MLEGADARFQVPEMRQLTAPGQPRPRLPGMRQAVPATRLEILQAQRPQIRTHQTQYLLIVRRQVFEAVRTATPDGPDATNGAAMLLSSPTPSPPPDPHPKNPSAWETSTTREGHASTKERQFPAKTDPSAEARNTAQTRSTHSRPPEHS